jgi:hypothetical protein
VYVLKMTFQAQPRETLAAFQPEALAAVVASRCQELSAQLGWPLVPPPVRVVAAGALREALLADLQARGERACGGPRRRRGGGLSGLASRLLDLLSPSVVGYFAVSEEALYLDAALAPSQAAYVLVHELVHVAQWQRFPGLFGRIDAGRVLAEDLIDQQGEAAPQAVAARDRYEALVTFLEGHATFHGRVACEQRLRRDAAQVSAEAAHAFVEALMGLDQDDPMTALLYVRGEQAVAAMDGAAVQAMFVDPELAVRRFTRLRG